MKVTMPEGKGSTRWGPGCFVMSLLGGTKNPVKTNECGPENQLGYGWSRGSISY